MYSSTTFSVPSYKTWKESQRLGARDDELVVLGPSDYIWRYRCSTEPFDERQQSRYKLEAARTLESKGQYARGSLEQPSAHLLKFWAKSTSSWTPETSRDKLEELSKSLGNSQSGEYLTRGERNRLVNERLKHFSEAEPSTYLPTLKAYMPVCRDAVGDGETTQDGGGPDDQTPYLPQSMDDSFTDFIVTRDDERLSQVAKQCHSLYIPAA